MFIYIYIYIYIYRAFHVSCAELQDANIWAVQSKKMLYQYLPCINRYFATDIMFQDAVRYCTASDLVNQLYT